VAAVADVQFGVGERRGDTFAGKRSAHRIVGGEHEQCGRLGLGELVAVRATIAAAVAGGRREPAGGASDEPGSASADRCRPGQHDRCAAGHNSHVDREHSFPGSARDVFAERCAGGEGDLETGKAEQDPSAADRRPPDRRWGA
jgi:hypothetical protein